MAELEILFPNGQLLAAQVFVDDPLLGPIPWDGAVVVGPPVGGATSANQVLEISALNSIDSKLTNPVPVTGPLTDTQLRVSDVKITLDGESVAVTGTFFQSTQPISAVSLPLPTGAATLAGQTQPGIDIGDVTINNAAGAAAVNIQDGGNSITVDGTITATPTGTYTTKETRSATATTTSVADQATNITLLASNANRLGATIYNDSTVNLFLKLGATASLTSFTVRLVPNAYYEVPFNYTGIIDGIWASDASGSARITELT